MKTSPIVRGLACCSLGPLLVQCQSASVKLNEFPDASLFNGVVDSSATIANSQEDLLLLERDEKPAHATFKTGLYDGGTRYFEGVGYRIIDHRRMTIEQGRDGMLLGQTVFFERRVTGGRELEFSNARFVPLEEIDPR